MKQAIKVLSTLCLCIFSTVVGAAQSAISATGGTTSGTGGSVSYTVGQIVYSTLTGADRILTQGVQQTYEITIVSSIESPGISEFECKIYPNPTSGKVKLTCSKFDNPKMSYSLYDIHGSLLQQKTILSKESDIYLGCYAKALYFLKLNINDKEVKVFKIVKK